MKNDNKTDGPIQSALDKIVKHHDIDYERLWNTMTNTEKKILIGLSFSDIKLMSEEFMLRYNTGPSSTTYSGVRKLLQKGYVIRNSSGYEIDDPFFTEWIKMRRAR